MTMDQMTDNVHKTSEQKINELLGIKDDQSVDEFLDGIQADATEIQDTMNHLDDGVKSSLEAVDQKLDELKKNGNAPEALVDMDSSMKEVEDLIQVAKQLFKHVHTSLVTCDLVDPEAIQAAAKLLEGIHINIAEFISLYKDKQRYVDKIRVMVFQQEQKKELMAIKHKYDMELKQLNGNGEDPIDIENMAVYSQEQIVKLLDDKGKDD